MPRDVLRFEVLLYLSLLLDALSAALFGVGSDGSSDGVATASSICLTAFIIIALVRPGLARGAAAQELGALDSLWILRADGVLYIGACQSGHARSVSAPSSTGSRSPDGRGVLSTASRPDARQWFKSLNPCRSRCISVPFAESCRLATPWSGPTTASFWASAAWRRQRHRRAADARAWAASRPRARRNQRADAAGAAAGQHACGRCGARGWTSISATTRSRA